MSSSKGGRSATGPRNAINIKLVRERMMLAPSTPGELALVQAANESEVETKILLHLFRFLGYSDRDRADKPSIQMRFGRERKTKVPDFILYDGSLRSIPQALITVEAKATTEALAEAEAQAYSYSLWAGTPLYVACNGKELIAAQVVPGAEARVLVSLSLIDLQRRWVEVESLLARSQVIKRKESMAFLFEAYLPHIEHLPPTEFFYEYLRVARLAFESGVPPSAVLDALSTEKEAPAHLPVKVIDDGGHELDDEGVANALARGVLSSVLIVGEAGCGKTTLARRIVRRLLEQASSENLLPIYLPLSLGVPRNVMEAFDIASKQLGVRVFPSLAQQFIERMQPVLVLDGLDEVAANQRDTIKAKALITGSRLVITSRSTIDETEVAILGYSRLTVAPLDDAGLQRVFEAFVDDSVVTTLMARVREDAQFRSPLMALLLLRLAIDRSDFTGTSPFMLFRRYIEITHAYFRTGKHIDLESAVSSLARAAVFLRNRRIKERRAASFAEFVDFIETDVGSSMGSAISNMGLVYSVGGVAQFVHNGFEQYLCAVEMLRRLRNRDWLGASTIGAPESLYEPVALLGGVTLVELLLDACTDSRERAVQVALGVALYLRDPRLINYAKNRLRLQKEESEATITYLVRVAIGLGPEGLLAWISSDKVAKRYRHAVMRRSVTTYPTAFLAWMTRETPHHGWLGQLLLEALARSQSKDADAGPIETQAWDLYSRMIIGDRMEACRRLYSIQGLEMPVTKLTSVLLQKERAASIIAILVPILKTKWTNLSSLLIDRMTDDLAGYVRGLTREDVGRLTTWLSTQVKRHGEETIPFLRAVSGVLKQPTVVESRRARLRQRTRDEKER